MKIGIALGGGAAKGLAHLGILKTLRNAGVPIDVVAGTSVGALVGAALASGRLEELEERALTVKLRDIPLLLTPTLSRQGLFSGRSALELLSEVVGTEAIEDLQRPFAAVSVDLNSGEVVTFTRGDLQQAIRASIAIPILFTPVQSGDRLLVDGGVAEPVPVRAARELGADFVIAIDLFGAAIPPAEIVRRRRAAQKSAVGPLQSARSYLLSLPEKLFWGDSDCDGGPSPSIIEIVEGTTGVMQRKLTQHHFSVYAPDFVIAPNVPHVGLLDFHRGADVISLGQSCAEECLDKLRAAIDASS